MKIKDLQFERDEFSLGPIRFDFEETGLYFLQGRNGSGKTSLMRLLMGRLDPSRGSVLDRPQFFLYLGVEGFFFKDWTIHENWNYFSEILNQSAELPAACQEFRNRKLKDLSLGQRQKMECLMLFGWKTPAYFLDEVLTHLDGPAREEIQLAITKKSSESLLICSVHESNEMFGSYRGALSL
jgi:ABC-type multidrug transport system ATPase subunit